MRKKFKTPFLTVDGCLLKGSKVLLVRRAIEPFEGFWVLPGGHVEYNERVEDALQREMREELGLEVKIKKLIGVYSDPKRDPREHTVSIAFLVGSKSQRDIKLNFETKEYNFFPLNNLPKKIGFDHRKIIADAKKIWKK